MSTFPAVTRSSVGTTERGLCVISLALSSQDSLQRCSAVLVQKSWLHPFEQPPALLVLSLPAVQLREPEEAALQQWLVLALLKWACFVGLWMSSLLLVLS